MKETLHIRLANSKPAPIPHYYEKLQKGCYIDCCRRVATSTARLLWVELPILDNVRYDRDDVNPTKVHNVNELLHTSSTQFVVDDDEDEENEVEYEDEQEDVLASGSTGTGKKKVRGAYYGASIEKEIAMNRGTGVTHLEVLFDPITGKTIDKYGKWFNNFTAH
ncbi:hypothetical protein L6452_06010 [Arctium lappa]|uniref:Uncharacterized protein n=1 Tax=Arctium lappa TaxID=4217 RepID=A0ACB9EI15_ARCLA|nr:hypothetical protein L6452_06010 [Arctium lappa]